MADTSTARQAPPSPIKIQSEEYVNMRNSSVTVSPAESCGSSNVVKQLKAWEREAGIASSVNSSETSDPLSEDEMELDGDAGETFDQIEEQRRSGGTTSQSVKMQMHLQGMQWRLATLQRLMQEAVQQNKFRSCIDESAAASMSIDTDKEGVAESVVPSLSECEANGSKYDGTDSCSCSSGEECPPAVTSLLIRIKTLQAQLQRTADENQQLQNTVRSLEKENARLRAQTAFHTSADYGGCTCKSASSDHKMKLDTAADNKTGNNHDNSLSTLTTTIYGDPSAFQIVMKEDLNILKGHERCQHKLHELWDTVRKLKTFVATYEIERNAMKVERDDALAEAERADAENVRLASSSNPHQKIKYLQQMKKDNQALRRKNRALNVRIAKHAAKLAREKNGFSFFDDGLTIETLNSTLLDDPLPEFDVPSVRTGEEILRSMQNFSSFLEQRLEGLHMARQNLQDYSS